MANQKVMADLSLQLSAETAQLKKELAEARSDINKYGKQTQTIGKQVRNAWLQVTGAVVAARGAIKIAENILKSTQTTGDELTHTLNAMQGGLGRVAEKLASGDWSNFVTDVRNATEAAYNFSQAMDEIGDIERSLNVQKSENLLKIEELKLDVEKYRVTNPEKAREAAQEIVRISQEEIDKAVKLSEQKMEATKNSLVTTYGISDAQFELLLNYIRNYDKLTENELKQVKAIQDQEQAIRDKYKTEISLLRGIEAAPGATEDQKLLAEEQRLAIEKKIAEEIKANKDNASDIVAAYLELDPVIQNILDNSEKENEITRDSIANILIEGAERERRAVRYQKQGEVYLTTLDRQILKEQDINVLLDERYKKLFGLYDVEKQVTKEISDQEDIIQNMLDNEPVLGDVETVYLQPLQELKDELLSVENRSRMVADAIIGIGEAIGESIGGQQDAWRNLVGSVLQAGNQIMKVLLAEAIAGVIAGEAVKGLAGIVTGAIGVALLTGLWNSQVPKFADGGIVGGTSFTGDRVPAYLNSGEMILNTSQQGKLFGMINKGGSWETANVTIGFDTLDIALQKINKRKALV